MNAATKFTFDTIFDAGRDVVDARKTRQSRQLTETEIEAIRMEARAEGARSGEVRALEQVAAGTRETADAVRETMRGIAAQMETLRAEAATLAFALARKVASAAVAAYPVGEVEAALRQAMHEAIGEPRIVLHARPEVAEALADRIAEIAHEEGYEGRVQISADGNLHGADCRIDWRGGGAERTSAAIEAALGELMTRRFSTKAAQNGSDT